MTAIVLNTDARCVSSPSGTQAQFTTSGVLRRLDVGDRSLLMYPADELEAGLANLYLRIRGDEGAESVAMVGPGSASTISWSNAGPIIIGHWRDLLYTITFELADALTAWYWHVSVKSLRPEPTEIDLIYAQDLALAPYGAVRTNEYYVSQYLDLTLLDPPETDAEGNTRTLSISSAPQDDTLMVTTRMRDTAFKRVLMDMPIGSAVKLDGPHGELTLHDDVKRPAVFLAGGIGITPFRSIVFDAARRGLTFCNFQLGFWRICESSVLALEK